jgi:hypothetical protein
MPETWSFSMIVCFVPSLAFCVVVPSFLADNRPDRRWRSLHAVHVVVTASVGVAERRVSVYCVCRLLWHNGHILGCAARRGIAGVWMDIVHPDGHCSSVGFGYQSVRWDSKLSSAAYLK